jgi:hypothetical protein
MDKIWLLFGLFILASCSHVIETPHVEVDENTKVYRLWNRHTEVDKAQYTVKEKVYSMTETMGILVKSPNKKVQEKVKKVSFYQPFLGLTMGIFVFSMGDYFLEKSEFFAQERDKGKISDEVKTQTLSIAAASGLLFSYLLYNRNKLIDEAISIQNKKVDHRNLLTLNYKFEF